MTWLSFLFDVSLIVTVSCNVTIFYHVVSAFKRTKNGAFILLIFSSMLGVLNSVMSHTVGRQHLSGYDYIAYNTLWELAYYTNAILSTIAIVLLARTFLATQSDEQDPNLDASLPSE